MKHIIQITFLLLTVEQFLVKVNSSSNDSLGMEYTLINDYLIANKLKVCVLLSCNRADDNLKLFNTVQRKSDIWYSFYDISNESIEYESLLMRLSHHIGVVIDLNCSQIVDLLREISKRIFFHHERYWLMFSADLNQALDVLQKQNINVDAEVSIAIPVEDSGNKNYRLYDAHNPSSARGGLLNVTQIGTWSVRDGYNSLTKKTKLENRRNMNGITFKGVVTIPNIPEKETFLEHLESVDFPHLNTISRFNYRLFQIMQQMFNFTIFLQRASSWGNSMNGRWQGAIGMVNRQEVDLCESGFRWKNEHYEAFEATTNSYATRAAFIFRHPKLLDASTVFTEPFDKFVWISILLVCIVSSYFLRYIFTAENHRKVKVYFGNQSINDSSWSNSILLVFGILFQQGYSTEPLMISSRILTLTILVFSVLVSQFYAAFIVGSLLTEAPKSIKTMEQLQHSKLKFGIDDVPFILETFQQINDKPTVKLYERIIKSEDKGVMDLKNGLRLLKEGGFVFNTDATSSYLIIKKILTDDEICDLQDVAYTREIPTGPIVPKKSPLAELIKISIQRMAETGVLAYHSKIWIGTRLPCPDRIVEFVPVDLLHFSTALYLIIFGMFLSSLILFAEIATHRYQVLMEGTHLKDVLKNWLSFGEFENKLN